MKSDLHRTPTGIPWLRVIDVDLREIAQAAAVLLRQCVVRRERGFRGDVSHRARVARDTVDRDVDGADPERRAQRLGTDPGIRHAVGKHHDDRRARLRTLAELERHASTNPPRGARTM